MKWTGTGTKYGSPRLQPQDQETERPISEMAGALAAYSAIHRPARHPNSGVVTERILVRRVAAATSMPIETVAQVYGAAIAVMSHTLKRHFPVTLDGFGTFYHQPTPSKGTFSAPLATVLWRPAKTVQAAIADGADSSRRDSTAPIALRSGLPVLGKPSLPPIRAIDQALIDRWMEMKSGGGNTVFADPAADGRARRPWSDTIPVRSALMMLARWMPCPLHEVGYTPIEGQLEFDRTEAQNQILVAVEGLTERLRTNMNPRILDHILRVHPDDNPALHGITWSRITRYGPQFYDWLEFCGVRGRGTNPLLHLRRAYAVSIPRKYWLQLSLIDPLLQAVGNESPRTRALVYLLANGLRRREVARLKIQDLLLERGELRVYGKGSAHGPSGPRLRIVPLLPWTRQALDDWLVARATAEQSAWLFPRQGDPQQHMHSIAIQYVLKRYILRFDPENKALRQVTPHALRLWFVTRSFYNKVPTDQIMQATGHASLASMQTYLITHPDQTNSAYAEATKEQWF